MMIPEAPEALVMTPNAIPVIISKLEPPSLGHCGKAGQRNTSNLSAAHEFLIDVSCFGKMQQKEQGRRENLLTATVYPPLIYDADNWIKEDEKTSCTRYKYTDWDVWK